MTKLKDFLKPNGWKIGIFILIFLVGSLAVFCAFLYWKYFLRVDVTQSLYGALIERCAAVISFSPVSPILLPFGAKFAILPEPAIPTLSPVLVLIYWYLLACLIYFLFTKIKSAFTKHNG